MKPQLFMGLVVGLAWLSDGGSGAASDQPAAAVQKKLDTPITLKADDMNTPLRDVLDYLGGHHGLTITLDRPAFAKAGLQEIEAAPIKLIGQKDVPLGKVLQRLLDQVPATYTIQGDGIVVIPPRKVKTACAN